MYCTQAWGSINPALNHRILESACLGDKKLYRRTVQDLAANLRRRPQAILDMPRTARHELFHPLLALSAFELLAQNLVIHWLKHERLPMVAGFLDDLGVPHDGNGFVDDFPEDMPKDKLKRAVEKLLKDYPDGDALFYLSVFDTLTGTAWEELPALLPEQAAPPAS